MRLFLSTVLVAAASACASPASDAHLAADSAGARAATLRTVAVDGATHLTGRVLLDFPALASRRQASWTASDETGRVLASGPAELEPIPRTARFQRDHWARVDVALPPAALDAARVELRVGE